MNQIIDSFPEILDFAKNYNLPVTKKRAILREYLQSKILSLIYKNKLSVNLYFVGGTSIRLLHNLDRFSEDLDFDFEESLKLNISGLITDIHRQIIKENIEVELYKSKTAQREYFELRFPHLLSDLKINSDKEEKLAIMLDFEHFWRGQTREVKLFNRYGFLVKVISIPFGQMLVQKLYAYLHRRQTLVRDLYDIIWLLSHNTKFDRDFSQKNKIDITGLINTGLKKFLNEEKGLKNLKLKLAPYLVDEENADKLILFADLLRQIS